MVENQTKSYCNGLKEKEFWISGQVLFFQKHETKLYSIIYLQIKPVEEKIKICHRIWLLF